MFIAKSNTRKLKLLPQMINRHGLISGVTGSGKSITLQVIVEELSRIGVPIFLADVKGDLAGLSEKGIKNDKIEKRLSNMNLKDFNFERFPVTFWDIFGTKGHLARTTVESMGPILLGRLLDLNETQTGTLIQLFKIAKDNTLPLIHLRDLQILAQYITDNSKNVSSSYGRISNTSIGAIQRSLLVMETENIGQLFGKPSLDINDLLIKDVFGYGNINILSADVLIQFPRVYSIFLLWLLTEVYNKLPEIGDTDKPKMAFFFDEAHLIFDGAPKILLEKVEQLVRLARSKGIGIYFITQSPIDIPVSILGQLGNRVQHALRTFTPKDQKAVRIIAQTFRTNDKINTEKTITELNVGEALISFLDEHGTPNVVCRSLVRPPSSKIGIISKDERSRTITSSQFYKKYGSEVHTFSAYNILQDSIRKQQANKKNEQKQKQHKKKESPVDVLIKSLMRSTGSSLGKTIGKVLKF